MPRKKPIGLDGSLTHETGPNIDKRTFNRHIESKEKGEIEGDIAARFKYLEDERCPGSPLTMEQLPENDLDYKWSHHQRNARIELTELVLKIPPYKESGQSATIYYKPWAEKFEALVEKKSSKHYELSGNVDLLMYTTHFAYHGNELCAELAGERLRAFGAGDNFDRIYYMEFRGVASRLYLLKPNAGAMSGSRRRELETHWYMNVNFAEGTPVIGGTRFDLGNFPKD